MAASKIQSAHVAVKAIPNGANVTITGFVGVCCPEYILNALRKRFDDTGEPRELGLIWGISSGDKKGRGYDVLAVEGLVSSMVYAWTATAPKLADLARKNKVKAWNLPLGMIAHMIRAAAGGKPGIVSKIGLGTFVDPRLKGGRLNHKTTSNIVEVFSRPDGEEYLWYNAPKIDVAILRATRADSVGNISFSKEPLVLSMLDQAIATKNNGGIVIVQVEEIVECKTLTPREVHIPGLLVDYVVVAEDPATHTIAFNFQSKYDPSLTGNARAPAGAVVPMKKLTKKILAHRAMLEINQNGMVLNLGVGTPEFVSTVMRTHGGPKSQYISARPTVEAGLVGGTPLGGLLFGVGLNPDSIIPTATMMDFYQGGGLDIAGLGMGECGPTGNVNVTNFGGRMPGCGGFIDISQSAKKVIFMSTFTAGGLKIAWKDGQLQILREGKVKKFVKKVNEVSFASTTARASGQTVIYVTERAVFELVDNAIELVEIAPGIDLQRQVLDLMEFKPLLRQPIGVMKPEIFDIHPMPFFTSAKL